MSDTKVKAALPLMELRDMLATARESREAERIHAALIDVVDGLITHAEKQADLLAAIRSDLGHKQGIVTRFDGRDFTGSQDNNRSD